MSLDLTRFSLQDKPITDWQRFQRCRYEKDGKKCENLIVNYLLNLNCPTKKEEVLRVGLAPEQVEGRDLNEEDLDYFNRFLAICERFGEGSKNQLLEAFKKSYPLINRKIWQINQENSLKGLDPLAADKKIRTRIKNAKKKNSEICDELKLFKNDPDRQLSFLAAKIQSIKKQLTIDPPSGTRCTLESIQAFLGKVGEVLISECIPLRQLPLDLVRLDKKQTLGGKLKECQELFEELVGKQKHYQKIYEDVYSQERKRELNEWWPTRLFEDQLFPKWIPTIYMEKWHVDQASVNTYNKIKHKILNRLLSKPLNQL